MKKFCLSLCLLFVFSTLLCNLNLYASQGKQNEENYNIEVRGLVLKYVLIGTAYEIYQVNDPAFSKFFFNEENYKKYGADTYSHYLWLKNTYEKFTPEAKNQLTIIYGGIHPSGLLKQTTPLNDNATLEETIKQLNYIIFPKAEIRSAINKFYPYFYDNFFEEYFKKNIPIFESYAKNMNKELNKNNADILSFMEKTSGIEFKEKLKPVFYYLLNAFTGYGFEYKNIRISTLTRRNTDYSSILYVPFHEYSHSLFQTFTSSPEFLQVAENMKKDSAFVKQHNNFKNSYDWTGWCEDNLVEGFAKYLNYKYYGTTKEKTVRFYDADFCNYLTNTNFDPAKTTLKDASINFYKSILVKKKIK